MLDTLKKICDDGGRLLGVSQALFEGNPRFITAIALRFEHLSAVFRAVSDDDTLVVRLELFVTEPGETIIVIEDGAPWSVCLGFGICWAWRLTNHQGYTDGVRLEFSDPGKLPPVVIELIVVASAIEVFLVARDRV